jgi:hypothetical protein
MRAVLIKGNGVTSIGTAEEDIVNPVRGYGGGVDQAGGY